MNYETLFVDKKDRIGYVTINRPDKLNALNAKTKDELRDAFEGFRDDSEIDAVILTGQGEKAFVAGTDIQELTSLDEATGRAFSQGGQALMNLIENLGKPVIAAINGYALGGGAELALACHIRIASETARIGQPEVNLGVLPGYGGTQRLGRLVGKGKAAEMILTGDPVDAQEALRIGLVNSVVPAAELLKSAEGVAKKISSKGPVAVRLALQAVMALDETTLTEGLAVEAGHFGRCCGSDDFREGTKAFLEKRKPVFKGT